MKSSLTFRAIKQKMRDSLPIRLLLTVVALIVAAMLTVNGHPGSQMVAGLPLAMVPFKKAKAKSDDPFDETDSVLEKWAKMEPFATILEIIGAKGIDFRKSAKGTEYVTFHKDVSGAIRAARIAAGASEQQAADALGVDLNDYVDFEENGGELDITAANMKSLAKAFKMPVEELAAQLVATPKPVAPAMSGEGNSTSGDQSDPPGSGSSTDPTAMGKSTRFGSRVALEKAALPSTQIRSIRIGATGGELDAQALLDVSIPIEKRKQEAQRLFVKSLLNVTESEYQSIRKSGLITADMFGPNPTIDPVLANTIINLFVGEDQFLKQVQTKILSGKKQNVNVMDIPFRSATRLDPNVWPASSIGVNPINRSLQMDADPIDFTWIVPDDTLMTYRGNLPQLEAEITGGFVKALATDIWDLGLNGTTATYDGSTFTTLKRGWFSLLTSGNEGSRLAIDAATPAGQQISISGGGYTTVDETLDAMLSAAFNPTNGNQRFFSQSTPILMSSHNWQLYNTQLKASHPTFLIPQSGLPPTYEGHALNVSNKLADTQILLTEMSNLVVGIVAGMPGAGGDGISVERFRVPKATRMIATVYLDFGIANSKAAVIAVA